MSLFLRRRGTIAKTLSLAFLVSFAGTVVRAGDRGTPAKAKAMLQKTVAHNKEVGRQQALAGFNNGKTPFRERDLYVVCIGPDRKILANGGFPQYVGVSADMLKDATRKSAGKAGWDLARFKGEGSVKYDWINPLTQVGTEDHVF
jgi:cytochrome c